MQRRLCTWLTVLIVATIPAAATAASLVASNVQGRTPPRIYLALGDSLAAGVGATAPSEGGYVGQLYAQLRESAHLGISRVMNLGIPGETSDSMLRRSQLQGALLVINDPSTEIGLLTLDIGGNDFLNLLFAGPCGLTPTGDPCQQAVGAALTTFVANYTEILQALTDALAADSGGAPLVVMTLYNPFSGTGAIYEVPVDVVLQGSDGRIDCDAADPAALGLNDHIACIGWSFGATVVDVQPPFIGRGLELTLIGRQDIHPNDAGHALIADLFVEELLAIR